MTSIDNNILRPDGNWEEWDQALLIALMNHDRKVDLYEAALGSGTGTSVEKGRAFAKILEMVHPDLRHIGIAALLRSKILTRL